MDAEGTAEPAASSGWSSLQKWTPADDQLLRDLVPPLLPPDGVLRSAHWTKLAANFPGRSFSSLQNRWSRITCKGAKRAPKKSLAYHSHAPNSNAWKKSPNSARTVGPRKTSSQLLTKGQTWTPEDDDLLHKLVSDPEWIHKKYDWERMSKHFVGRTAKATENHWYARLKAKGGTQTWSAQHIATLKSLAADGKVPCSEIANACGGRSAAAVSAKWAKIQKAEQALPAPAPVPAIPPSNATPSSPHAGLESTDASALKVTLSNPRYLNKSTIAAPSSPPIPIPIASSASGSSDATPPPAGPSNLPSSETASSQELKITLFKPLYIYKAIVGAPSSSITAVSSNATAPPASPSTAPPASPSNPASSKISYQSLNSSKALPSSSSASSQAVAPPTPLAVSQYAAFAGLDNALAAIRRIRQEVKERARKST